MEVDSRLIEIQAALMIDGLPFVVRAGQRAGLSETKPHSRLTRGRRAMAPNCRQPKQSCTNVTVERRAMLAQWPTEGQAEAAVAGAEPVPGQGAPLL
jgi:hypothetical protein